MMKAVYVAMVLWFARRVLRKTRPTSREPAMGAPGKSPLPPSGTYAMFLVDHCEEPAYYMYGSKFDVPDDEDSRLKVDTLMRLIKFHYSAAQTNVAFNVEILPSDGPEDMVGEYSRWTRENYGRYDKVMSAAYGHVLDIIPARWFLD